MDGGEHITFWYVNMCFLLLQPLFLLFFFFCGAKSSCLSSGSPYHPQRGRAFAYKFGAVDLRTKWTREVIKKTLN